MRGWRRAYAAGARARAPWWARREIETYDRTEQVAAEWATGVLERAGAVAIFGPGTKLPVAALDVIRAIRGGPREEPKEAQN